MATFASVGAGVRCGLGVPDEFDDAAWAPPLRVYLTAAVDARLVGHNVFLDGTVFRRRGPRIEKVPLVADVSLGLVLAVHDRLSVSYTHTIRTAEFTGQAGMDQFGSVGVSVAW